MMKKHGQAAALRHLIPGVFVGALSLLLILLLVLSLWASWGIEFGAIDQHAVTCATTVVLALCAAQASLYVGAVGAVSLLIARQQGMDLVPHLPRVIAAYHFGYGLGSIRGWFDALVRGRPDPAFGRLTR